MRKGVAIGLAAVTIALAVAAVTRFGFERGREDAARDMVPTIPFDGAGADSQYADIAAYMRTNISEISPVKERLGGAFYVTALMLDETAGKGVVEYEDGHDAYAADFAYRIEPDTGRPVITSFEVRSPAAHITNPS